MNKYFEHFDYTPRWKILNLVLYSENEQYYIDMSPQEEYLKISSFKCNFVILHIYRRKTGNN